MTESAVSDEELLERHAPILRFDERELFHPTEVDSYVDGCSMWVDGLEVASPGSFGLDELDQRWGERAHLRWVSDDDLKAVVREEAARLARTLLTPRLGRVGLFGRILDALFLVSVLFRPTTPRRTTPAAAMKAERREMHRNGVCYGRVVRSGDWLVLHYSYFYVMNDWRTGYRGVNDHEADWEQAWVFCDPGSRRPCWVVASSHDHSGSDLRRHWTDPEVIKEGDRPVLYAGAGSHALYFQPGDYVTRVDVPGLRWLLRVQRWTRSVLRIRDEATERGLGPALGVPFVDTATGDGRSIEQWDLRVIDDSALWAHDYRGLWGLDTGDPLEGERAPAGPKFDRRGEVRSSWADPVGFAGLHGTPPPSAATDQVNLTKLALAIEDLDDEIGRRGRLLPLIEQSANPHETGEETRRLTELFRQRANLVDLERRLRSGDAVGDQPSFPSVPDIRGHLVHPSVPLPPPAASGWILAFWAAASIPLLLLAVGAVVVFEEIRLAGALIAVVAFAAMAEQLARRHFGAVVRLAILYVAFGVVSAFAVGVAMLVGRYAIAGLLAVGAVVLFFVNVGELGAAQRARKRAAAAARSARTSPD